MLTTQKSKTKAKPRGKPIAKGQVLNPGGRPKKTAQELDLIAACKDKTPEALYVIAEIMSHGEKEQTRLAAALAIIERAYGKPVQPQDVSVTGNLDTKSADTIFDLMREVSQTSGTTFLIVTHDPRLAKRCDRIIELVDGGINSDKPNATTHSGQNPDETA